MFKVGSMTQLQDIQGFYNPFDRKNAKYNCCVTCDNFGSVFRYRTLRTEMVCGFGENNCNEVFGKPYPSGFVKKHKKRE